MLDIKLTLSQDTIFHASDADVEARWQKQEGHLSYPLPQKPLRASAGCWVYFIHDGQLVARAKAIDFVTASEIKTMYPNHYSFTGQPAKVGKWNVICTEMELAKKDDVAHQGFQGFRYVKPEEQALLESAF